MKSKSKIVLTLVIVMVIVFSISLFTLFKREKKPVVLITIDAENEKQLIPNLSDVERSAILNDLADKCVEEIEKNPEFKLTRDNIKEMGYTSIDTKYLKTLTIDYYMEDYFLYKNSKREIRKIPINV